MSVAMECLQLSGFVSFVASTLATVDCLARISAGWLPHAHFVSQREMQHAHAGQIIAGIVSQKCVVLRQQVAINVRT